MWRKKKWNDEKDRWSSQDYVKKKRNKFKIKRLIIHSPSSAQGEKQWVWEMLHTPTHTKWGKGKELFRRLSAFMCVCVCVRFVWGGSYRSARFRALRETPAGSDCLVIQYYSIYPRLEELQLLLSLGRGSGRACANRSCQYWTKDIASTGGGGALL